MNQPTVKPSIEVYGAIHHVMEDMAKSGVGKNKQNTQQNFTYRGVDDVMDALAPSLARHGLIIVPHVREHSTVERESRNGGKLFHTLLQIDYDFICVKDGSTQLVGPIYGEAMDAGDKATNKAMATAYKYACVQTFCIPITGDDPDGATHEVVSAQGQPAQGEPHQGSPKGPRESATPPPPAPARSPGAKPDQKRVGGNFGYGKKHYDTPWQVMKGDDLEWFLNAERTPQHIREKIVNELSWREYETAQLEAGIARQREEDGKNPIGEDVP